MDRNGGCLAILLLLVALVFFSNAATARGDVGGMDWPNGISGGGDCDDTDAGVFPGQDEIVGNRFDDDCDGLADEDMNNNPSGDSNDADGDGQSPASGDCNDTDPLVSLGASESPGNFIDDDCDGLADEDAMGNPSPDVADHDDDGVTIGFDLIFKSGFEILP